ncbi:TRAP transporter permease [Thalassovita taeanensis]|uniref:TRAP transporter, 4TM/12TM fusion protein n=1 Tax=Thalassovita taeanensis TaxID=657014 RepID=A0A1H9IY59_9RHOB|nr:TRAP transporter fused permease subunit [Thalassovita taeanensis]SEQ79459.1 TRAP transporter, 4TM/12TM fusion protein [Thalassovita taeanensis]
MSSVSVNIASKVQLVLRVALILVIFGWILDIPGYFGKYYYTEQLLALVAGLAATITLTDPRWGRTPARATISLVLGLTVFIAFGYVSVRYPSLQLELASAPPGAVALGLLMVLGILEAARRQTGIFLPLLLLALVLFSMFIGPKLPDGFQTRELSFSRLSVYLALDTNALFSKILDIAAITVAPFIVFGFLLNAFGGSAVFSDLAAKLVGKYTGGPAKVSVVGSAAFGMVSGSAVANVVAVGSVSIPMMARAGYARHVAAAIEAVASTGGQLVPPIMGASAFLMAELLEMPYRDVALAAILPSLLFYAALMLAVDFEARRLKIGGTSDRLELPAQNSDAPDKHRWRYLIPVGILIYLLFFANRTAGSAGLWSAISIIAVHLIGPPAQIWHRLQDVWKGLLQSAAAISDIIILASAAGLIIGVLNLTGIAFQITLQMLAISGGDVGIMLLLTAGLSILLGLGMPTVGVYVLLATLAAPALIELGIQPIAAHMYVLYFGMVSMITPPIAIASFAAATVAAVSPWRTSFASLKVGAGVYLVPVAFVTQPELLLDGTLLETATALTRTLMGIGLLTLAAIGHMSRPIPLPVRIIAGLLAVANVLPVSALPQLGMAAVAACSLAILAWAAVPARTTPSLKHENT